MALGTGRVIDPIELAQRLARLQIATSRRASAPDARVFEIGGGIATICASSDGKYASQNLNKVRQFGVLGDADASHIKSLLGGCLSEGVARFFFYVPPSGRQLTLAATLVANNIPLVVAESVLACHAQAREVDADVREVPNPSELSDLLKRGFDADDVGNIIESLSEPECTTYAAYIDGGPVATGSTHIHGGLAYLGWGCTDPDYRRQGLHAALVKARINDAQKRGCDIACSVTYDFVKSYDNLIRCGLAEVYRTPIFEWTNPQIIGEDGSTAQ